METIAKSSLEVVKVKWIALTLVILFSSFSQAQSALGGWGGPLDAMPPEERGELMKIISKTSLEGEVTLERHQRFWEIVDSNRLTNSDVQELWDKVLGRSCVYPRYITLAVLDAFYNKRDTKSSEFKEYEDRLVRLGVLSAEEVKKSDEFIYKAAHEEPVRLEDISGSLWQEKVFDEELAQSYRDTFDQIDKQYRCLLKLFDRKCKGYQ
ncbi:MAG TPA: hypothetical protein ACFYD3_03290 [Candidatus Hypogeohydataceae bacterium YC41]